MISFSTAKNRVLEQVGCLVCSPHAMENVEDIPLYQALGRVLAQPAIAADNVPNHDNSAMDGYAVRCADLSSETNTILRVVADLPAGSRVLKPLEPGEAIRIMTGAPIPAGSDCVIMQEVVRRQGNRLEIPPSQKIKAHGRMRAVTAAPGQNIRSAGEDIRMGSEVLPAGQRLGPADLGLLTSLGVVRVRVFRRIRVALLSTGNEVLEAGAPLKPGQVYDSNRSALHGALEALGVEVLDLGLVLDDREALEAALKRGGEEADALISTGGVSVGDYDLVKEVLEKDGRIHFWKVSMKPGKPQAYGQLGQAHFFGLPGNPVSSLTVFLLIVRPALLKMMGANEEPERRFQAVFRGGWQKRHERMEFLRGVVHFTEDRPWVEVTGAQGSGILTSLAKANAFIVLPEGAAQWEDGALVTVQLIDYV